MTLGYLGPEGTFSQQAARDYDGAARHVAYPNIAAAMEAAAARSARMATRGINMVKIESRPDKQPCARAGSARAVAVG